MLLAAVLAGCVGIIVALGLERAGVSSVFSGPWPLCAVVLLGSAVVGVTAQSHATDSDVADLVWRIFLASAFAITARRTKRIPLLVAATVAAVAASGSSAWIGFAAIGLAVVGSSDPAKVGSGLFVASALLHASWPGGTGRSAALTAALLVLVVIATDRRFVRRAALLGFGVALVCGIATAVAGLALAGERSAAQAAVDRGQAGLDAARDGRSRDAATDFSHAEHGVQGVLDTLGGWLALPARSVPVVGANLGEARRLLDVARSIAASGVATSRAADVDRIAPRDGAIDLVALRSFGPPLRSLDGTLTRSHRSLAAVGSPWTVRPLSSRIDDLDARVIRAQHDARRARRAVDAIPGLLGADGTRRYFLAVMTPSELRAGGGFVGNWGILEATDGRISLPRFDRITDLYRAERYDVTVDPDYDARYVDYFWLDRYPQNILSSPDLPSDARAIAQILRQAGEGDVDGIIAIDPIAMASLLQLTGPIDAGWGEPLTAGNVAEILLYKQYEHAQDPRRPELLARTTRTLFERLTHGTSLPAASTIARTLGPAVEGGHLQFASLHPSDQRVLDDAGLRHALPPVERGGFQVVGNSSVATKLDWFLRRAITYDIHVDRAGRASATVTVEVRNVAPAKGLPEGYYEYKAGGLAKGVNGQDVSLYTGLELVGASVDGSGVHANTWREAGWNVFDTFVVVPPGATRTVVVRLRGRQPVRNGQYTLDLRPQATAVPDDVRVTVNGDARFDGPLVRPTSLRIPVG